MRLLLIVFASIIVIGCIPLLNAQPASPLLAPASPVFAPASPLLAPDYARPTPAMSSPPDIVPRPKRK